MFTNLLQSPKPITIPLSVAREALKSPQALDALIDRLGNLSEGSIEELGPLVFDVLKLGEEFPVVKLIKRILKKRPEWANQKLDDTYNLLSESLVLKRFDLVDFLLKAGVDPTYETASEFSVLDFAASVKADVKTQEAYGNSLLRSGAHSNTQKERALAHAANNGNLGIVKSLLAHGTGFSVEFPNGTALARACDTIDGPHQLEIVQALLQAPGVSGIIDHGWGNINSPPAITRAASEGNVHVMRLLLAAGARVNPPEHMQSSGCQLPLLEASRWLQPEAVDLLIKSGADPTAIDSSGRNAFHRLVTHFSWKDPSEQKSDRLRIIDLLLDAGTDPMQKDHSGNTPLDTATQRQTPAIIEDLSTLAARQSSRHLGRDTPRPVERRPTSARRL